MNSLHGIALRGQVSTWKDNVSTEMYPQDSEGSQQIKVKNTTWYVLSYPDMLWELKPDWQQLLRAEVLHSTFPHMLNEEYWCQEWASFKRLLCSRIDHNYKYVHYILSSQVNHKELSSFFIFSTNQVIDSSMKLERSGDNVGILLAGILEENVICLLLYTVNEESKKREKSSLKPHYLTHFQIYSLMCACF